MDGKGRKGGWKRGSKIVEVGIDADDDEPIGSLFKLKRPKNSKKVNVQLESEKSEKVVVKEENSRVVEEDFGGMDDTLASFRKRLKGHKKGVGSVAMRESIYVQDGPAESGLALNVKLTSEIVEEGQNMGDSVSLVLMDKGLENNCKGKVKRSKIDSRAGLNMDSAGLHCEAKWLESQGVSLKTKNEDSRPRDSEVAVGSLGTDQVIPATTGDCLKSIDNCSADSSRAVRGELVVDAHGSKTQEGTTENSFSSKEACDGDSEHDSLMHLNDSASSGSKKSSSETEAFQDGNKLCSADDASIFLHDVVEGHASVIGLKHIKGKSEKACSEDAMHWQSCGLSTAPMSSTEPKVLSSLVKKDVPVLCSGVDNPNMDSVSASSQQENTLVCDCGFQANYQDRILERKEQVDSCQKCGFTLSESQLLEKLSKGTVVPGHSVLLLNEETAEASPMSITPDENESCPNEVVSLADSETKDIKPSAMQRPERNSRKRRLGDMAYEGDVDWEILGSEQGFLESQSGRSDEKLDSSTHTSKEAEIGRAAAVAAGLKARSVSLIEKIVFKEVLKRRGGLQEYLDCRNYILGLWSKNVSRILPITDCGIPGDPPANESPRASLVREVYKFLDQRGYINVGIASKKDKEEPTASHNYDLFCEKKLEESSMASVADSEDGVAFILGQVKTAEPHKQGRNGIINNDVNQVLEGAKTGGKVPFATMESVNATECELLTADEVKQNGKVEADPPNGLVNSDAWHIDESIDTFEVKRVPIMISEAKSDLQSVQSASYDHVGRNYCFQTDSKDEKKVIVIGAGPAGLTASRHLQRRGFSVTVLEARNRIGGRVYTDRSSLSVPVDLGASIITGIEADVASERMPDPSALVSTQLGLELTVLHGFCPLYDTVTGKKVPPELDDALQAEFNSLIDDVDLLVEQIGIERANRMSLEDGLEYGLRRLRMPHDTMDIEKSRMHDSAGSPEDDILSPLERRVMNWHFAHTEYGCAAFLKEVSLPNWNQDEYYGGFGGPHAMIKGGYSSIVESLGEGLDIRLNHVVTEVSYNSSSSAAIDSQHRVKVCTSDGSEFLGHALLVTVPLGCLKAETIKFSPPLPDWKYSSIKRLGFGVLNKVVLEFPHVFWDDSVDYFGATAEKTDLRGECFMFWNVRKTVGAPVLIALVVGKAAINFREKSTSEHVNHAMTVLRKLFGEASVPDPVGSVVTDWGTDPYSYGAYSYVAIGASGEDYDILGRPVQNCIFFAGEATCKEHPDTVGGAMISGLREAVRMIDIFSSGNDYTAELEVLEKSQRKSSSVRDEVSDIIKKLEVVELSNVLTRQALLRNMFFTAKTTIGRLHLAKELLNLPIEALKSFAGTKEGLTTLNSWILDSMGKNGTQLLRHCVHILVRVSSDLLAVRMSGIGKTVKEKVCAHTSRDIRAIASQLVSVWLELFRKEKANGGLKSSRQASTANTSRRRGRLNHGDLDYKGRLMSPASAGSHLPSNADNGKSTKLDTELEKNKLVMSEEERAAFAAAEAARAAAEAAAKAWSEANSNLSLQLPKIPSFHKFARREQYAQMEESEFRKKFPGALLGRQDCLSEIDSRNCKVRDWIDFPAACLNLDSARMSVDNHSQRSHSNEIACHSQFREHSGESAAVDSNIFARAWVDTSGSEDPKNHQAIDRWQSQAAAADPDFFNRTLHIKDEEDSNVSLRPPTWKHDGRPNESSRPPTWKHDGRANDSSISQVTVNKEPQKNHLRGADRIKQAVVDFVASLLMPLYKARKIDRDGYKSIMKKAATKVMEQATDAEKTMAIPQFLDSKRKHKIRAFVDKLIEKHLAVMEAPKP